MTAGRNFLQQSLLAAGQAAASALSSADPQPTSPTTRGPAQRILILGAGLAGLAAAYEFTQADHEVTGPKSPEPGGDRADADRRRPLRRGRGQ